MKKSTNFSLTSIDYLAIIGIFLSQTIMFAQDKTVDVNLNLDKGGDEWYVQPWAWVVGGAVFIIILVALLKGKK
jgi:hypothetical protein